MKSATEKICWFLNVQPSDLRQNPATLVDKMIKVVNDEDYEKLHHLGYELTLTRS